MTTLELTGLQAHHPLGFLAACGLLKCCVASEQFPTVRLAWVSHDVGPKVAVLHLVGQESAPDKLKQRILDVLIASADKLCQSHAFSWSGTIKVAPTVFRNAATGATEESNRYDASFFAAFASDLITSK